MYNDATLQAAREKLLNADAPDLNKINKEAGNTITQIQANIKTLDDSLKKIGTKADTKGFREKMKKTLNETTAKVLYVKEIIAFLQQTDLSTKKDNELRDKTLKKLIPVFNTEREKFATLARGIQAKEAQFVDYAKKSIAAKPSIFDSVIKQKTAILWSRAINQMRSLL
eukprot:TRINITY_DN6814_c0_g1_i1.p1 TRINITY_DN6814_c0_g1~~TRINITY_DN6814_c0_g1_i1.p1  ORF type:complete len:169 (-),score=48.77 TRINITY_DN6814_c0_g1_i1:672-1178(-)